MSQSLISEISLEYLEKISFDGDHVVSCHSEVANFFEKLLPKYSEKFINSISNLERLLLDGNFVHEKCQTTLQWSISVMDIIGKLFTKLKQSDIHLYSLDYTFGVIDLLNTSFGHCKKANEQIEAYVEYMKMCSSMLNNLFNSSYSLLVSVLKFIDGFKFNQNSDKSSSNTLSSKLLCLSDLSADFDIRIAVTVWKTFLRFLVRNHKEFLHNIVDIDSIISRLCKNISVYLCEVTIQCNMETVEMKGFCFYCKALVNLTKEFSDCMSHSVSAIYDLLEQLTDCHANLLAEATVAGGNGNLDELDSKIFFISDLIIDSLLWNKSFTQNVLKESHHKSDWGLILKSKILRLLLTISDKDIISQWMCEPNSILDSIFQNLESNNDERVFRTLSLKIYLLSNIHYSHGLDLFHVVYLSICCFSTCLEENEFDILLRVLLQNVLSHNLCVHLLCCDVLCFLARLGNASFCFQLCHTVCSLLLQLQDVADVAAVEVERLLRRLWRLLSAKHREELLQLYPVDVNDCNDNCIIYTALGQQHQLQCHQIDDTLTSISKQQLLLHLSSKYVDAVGVMHLLLRLLEAEKQENREHFIIICLSVLRRRLAEASIHGILSYFEQCSSSGLRAIVKLCVLDLFTAREVFSKESLTTLVASFADNCSSELHTACLNARLEFELGDVDVAAMESDWKLQTVEHGDYLLCFDCGGDSDDNGRKRHFEEESPNLFGDDENSPPECKKAFLEVDSEDSVVTNALKTVSDSVSILQQQQQSTNLHFSDSTLEKIDQILLQLQTLKQS